MVILSRLGGGGHGQFADLSGRRGLAKRKGAMFLRVVVGG